jgi:uncharacterized protein with GYD domain
MLKTMEQMTWRGEQERRTDMPKYIVLYKFTEQGMQDIKTLPQRVKEAYAGAEQQGVKVLSWHLTMGQYDAVTIVETDNEQTMVLGALALARNGNVRTETLPAFDQNEMEQIIGRLP